MNPFSNQTILVSKWTKNLIQGANLFQSLQPLFVFLWKEGGDPPYPLIRESFASPIAKMIVFLQQQDQGHKLVALYRYLQKPLEGNNNRLGLWGRIYDHDNERNEQ